MQIKGETPIISLHLGLKGYHMLSTHLALATVHKVRVWFAFVKTAMVVC